MYIYFTTNKKFKLAPFQLLSVVQRSMLYFVKANLGLSLLILLPLPHFPFYCLPFFLFKIPLLNPLFFFFFSSSPLLFGDRVSPYPKLV